MALKDLLEQRSTTVAAMRSLTDHPAGADGDLSDDQATAFDRHKASLENLEARIGRQQVIDDAERRLAAPAIVHGNGRDGRFEERARDFSLVKAINARLGEDVDAGFEREISAEVRHRSGRKFSGIACPDEYFQIERRTLLTTQPPELYPTMHRGDLFIDMLRSALVVGRLGATVLDGLVGTQEIPKQSASSVAQWVAEDGSLTETDLDTVDVTLAPKTVGAMTSYSRRTLINAVPSVEQIVRRDLAEVIARAIDYAALLGPGTGNTPTGIIAETGVNNPTFASGPTWPQVLAFISAIQTDNADLGGLAWVMHPLAVAMFRQTLKTAEDTASNFLMTEPGNLAGFPVATTTAIPVVSATPDTSTVIFGDFSQILLGYWSGLDVLLNPYETTAYAKGRVMLRAMRDVDIAVRHGEAFAFAADMPVE